MIRIVPSVQQSKPLMAEVKLIDRIVDASSRQARVWADLRNPDGRLMPGTLVTMIIPPAKK
jgi:multidrug efflux pump subunit AcrA (membrane-fusion protein)